MQLTCLQRKLVLVTSSPSETSSRIAYDARYIPSRKGGTGCCGYTGVAPSPKLETFHFGFDMGCLGGDAGRRNWGAHDILFFLVFYLFSALCTGMFTTLFYDLRSRNVGYRYISTRLTSGRWGMGVGFYPELQ
jgi:hypothetical protein